MTDLIMIGMSLGFFALSWGFVTLADRLLKGSRP